MKQEEEIFIELLSADEKNEEKNERPQMNKFRHNQHFSKVRL